MGKKTKKQQKQKFKKKKNQLEMHSKTNERTMAMTVLHTDHYLHL